MKPSVCPYCGSSSPIHPVGAEACAKAHLAEKDIAINLGIGLIESLKQQIAEVMRENARLDAEWKHAHDWNDQLVTEHYKLKEQIAELTSCCHSFEAQVAEQAAAIERLKAENQLLKEKNRNET